MTNSALDWLVKFLSLREVAVISESLARDGIQFVVHETNQYFNTLVSILLQHAGAHVIVFFPSIAALNSVLASVLLKTKTHKDFAKLLFYVMHSKLSTETLSSVWKEFSKRGGVLFGTDILAQGLDLAAVTVIVHVRAPKSLEDWGQKSGRIRTEGSDHLIAGDAKSIARVVDVNLRKVLTEGCVVDGFEAYFSARKRNSDATCQRCSRCVPTLLQLKDADATALKKLATNRPRFVLISGPKEDDHGKGARLKALLEPAGRREQLQKALLERLTGFIEEEGIGSSTTVGALLPSWLFEKIAAKYCVTTRALLSVGASRDIVDVLREEIMRWMKATAG